MIASSRCTELNGTLACFPDGATIRITYPAAYCRLVAGHLLLPRRGLSRLSQIHNRAAVRCSGFVGRRVTATLDYA